MEIITKKCGVCEETKPISEFPKAKDCRNGVRNPCKLCRSVYNTKYHQEHGKEVAAKKKQWWLNHKEEWARYSRKYYDNHKEERLAYSSVYEQTPKCRDRRKKYRQEHKEERATYGRQYLRKNREACRIRVHLRRARIYGNGGHFTIKQWNSLVAHYVPDGKCLCCGEIKPMTIDHVVPITKGGSSDIDNLQPLCKLCNCSKRDERIDFRPDGGEFANNLKAGEET